MCLEVSKLRHFFKRNPKIAKQDLCVYKIFKCTVDCDYVTPFALKKCFVDNNGIIEMSAELNFQNWIIFEGIHAFRTKYHAKKLLRWFNKHFHWRKMFVLKGYIPKGSKYYIGRKGEIVSNHMIIFTENYK